MILTDLCVDGLYYGLDKIEGSEHVKFTGTTSDGRNLAILVGNVWGPYSSIFGISSLPEGYKDCPPGF